MLKFKIDYKFFLQIPTHKMFETGQIFERKIVYKNMYLVIFYLLLKIK